jgi:hypothetical protein
MVRISAAAAAVFALTVAACGGGTPADTVVAAPYINPDTGAATANPDVNANSECETPDRDDDQVLSPAGSASANVHIDACLFQGSLGGTRIDGPATFESSGVGVISACPDPDGASGPKTAMLSDSNNDGKADRCTQSGFQMTGADGDTEFHARMNNSDTPGTQTVVFCRDENLNGCSDEQVKNTVEIRWRR